jgi:hypothetical protein
MLIISLFCFFLQLLKLLESRDYVINGKEYISMFHIERRQVYSLPTCDTRPIIVSFSLPPLCHSYISTVLRTLGTGPRKTKVFDQSGPINLVLSSHRHGDVFRRLLSNLSFILRFIFCVPIISNSIN